MNRRRATPLLTLLPLALVAATGCSEGDEARVSGTVLVDNQPVKSGYMEFHPADGRGSVTGGPIVDGKYSANATIGAAIVKIRVPRGTGVFQRGYAEDPNSAKELAEESLPAKYNDQSELRLEIQPGENQKDFTQLESK